MALTDAQKVDVRRWAGYGLVGDSDLSLYAEQAYSGSVAQISLADRLDNLTTAEEDVLTTTYLANLATLEMAIVDSSENLDTKVAGPWEANPNELGQRTRLFKQWRRDMCDFLGVTPGPALGSGGLFVTRV